MSQPNNENKKDEKEYGLVCSNCGCRHFITNTTRPVGDMIVRYRQCRYCGRTKTTYESSIRPKK